MKPPLDAMSRSRWFLARQDTQVHGSLPPWGRRQDPMGRSAVAGTGAVQWIGPGPVRDLGRSTAAGAGRRHLGLAARDRRADTVHHATERGASRAREGGFVQRQII
jgi:hypothetical protein